MLNVVNDFVINRLLLFVHRWIRNGLLEIILQSFEGGLETLERCRKLNGSFLDTVGVLKAFGFE